jgi:hypothetical protein
LPFLSCVENAVDSGGGFGTGPLIADRDETWTPCDEGFRDGVEDEKLVVVVRVRRLVAIGSSSGF